MNTNFKFKFITMVTVAFLLCASYGAMAYSSEFIDVSDSDWFAESLERVYKIGLVNGVSDNEFNPGGNITAAETAAFASRIHTNMCGDGNEIKQGTPWYKGYVDYLVKNSVITDRQFGDYNVPITRAQFISVIAHSVTPEMLRKINNVEDGAIIDVPMGAAYSPEVYLLYRAGVLTGNNERGDFEPNSKVTRAEAVAVIDRIINMEQRQSVSLKKTYNDQTVKRVSAENMSGVDVNALVPIGAANEYIVPTGSLMKEFVNSEAIYSLGNNWYYSTESGERDEYIESIFTDLFEKFTKIFGRAVMTYKPCIIYNDTKASNPVTYYLGEVNVITLHTSKTSLWCKVIYQLSHEMTHYAYGSLKPDANLYTFNETFTKWNEEIICEAMSLYMLNYMYETWDSTQLSGYNKDYGSSVKDYLDDVYNECLGYGLKSENSKIYTQEEFKNLSDLSDEADERAEHSAECGYLYDLMLEYGDGCFSELLNMYDFYNPSCDCIEYDEWERYAYDCDFIEKMSRIQPRIAK